MVMKAPSVRGGKIRPNTTTASAANQKGSLSSPSTMKVVTSDKPVSISWIIESPINPSQNAAYEQVVAQEEAA